MATTNHPDTDGPYTVISIKAKRTYADLSLAEAISAAKAHDDEYQPDYGTQIANARGETVWDSEDCREPTTAAIETNYVVVDAPGHYGDRTTVLSAHGTRNEALAALQAANETVARYVARESTRPAGDVWLRVYDQTAKLVRP